MISSRSLNFLLDFGPVHPSETALRWSAPPRSGSGLACLCRRRHAFARDDKAAVGRNAPMRTRIAEFEKVDTNSDERGWSFGTRDYLKNDYLMRYAVLALRQSLKPRLSIRCTMSMTKARSSTPHNTTMHCVSRRTSFLPLAHSGRWAFMRRPAARWIEEPNQPQPHQLALCFRFEARRRWRSFLHLQHEPPADDKKANWLPAPDGPFIAELRICSAAGSSSGNWNEPPVKVD